MTKSRSLSRYGWRRDLPDQRDKLYRLERTQEVVVDGTLPSRIDLRANMPEVFNQGHLGSCTANAIAGAIGYLQPGFMASRLFIYYNEREIEGSVLEDSGAQIRDGIKSVASQGVCSEGTWPYDESQFTVKPWQTCYQEALKDVLSQYLRVNGLLEMKSCLAAGFPFVFGFSVYGNFESQAVKTTGELQMPDEYDEFLGGHAVLCVGYDDVTERVIVRNSWGKDWGMGGYFTMPYEYIKSAHLASDMWTIRK